MDHEKDTDKPDYSFELADDEAVDETGSVDDFIRELEAKEKDLHITSETTFIEIAADFDEAEVPDFIVQEPSKDVTKPLRPLSPKADTGAVKKLEADLAGLQKKVVELEEQRAELYQNAQRRQKDFENYKARNERERSESFQRQLSNLATQMLPALDNLDRALECASDLTTQKEGEFAQFFDGIVLVNQQVNEVLAGMGIMPIATVGEQFDPHLHEAVAIDESEEVEPNTITSELLRGFRIGDNIIRHYMVKVSQPPKSQVPETSTELDGEESSETKTGSPVPEAGAFGEFDPDEVTAANPADSRETVMTEMEADNAETKSFDFTIERNGEEETPKKSCKSGPASESSEQE